MASRYLDPQTLSKIDRLDLRARYVVEGFISGMHRSPYHGFSVEFAQHRGYVPGDDLKHLDWRVYAKSERYYVKQYEEETNLVANILLDASESMAYGSPRAAGRMSKLEYAKLVTASLSYLILGQSDAVAVGVFDRDIKEYIERSTNEAHIHRICDVLERLSPEKKTDIGGILKRFAERIRRRGIVVLISDLFDDPEGIMAGIRRLRFGKHEVVVFHLLDEYELTFPFEGLIQFKGLEETGEALCHPRMLRKHYLEELNRYLSKLRSECRRAQVDYVQVDTSTPVDVVLSAYLASRYRIIRAGRGGGTARP